MGQNLGRKRSDRAECVTVICNRLATTMAILMVAGLILFRAPLIQMFTADPEIIQLGSWIMILFALSVPSLSAMTVYGGALRGAGDTRLIAVYALISTTIIRPAPVLALMLSGGVRCNRPMDRFACRLCVAVFALPPALPDRIVEAAGLLISLNRLGFSRNSKALGQRLNFHSTPNKKLVMLSLNSGWIWPAFISLLPPQVHAVSYPS